MQGDSLLSLSEQQWMIQTCISRLNTALAGSNGFRCGIYDISGTIDKFSVGVYEIVFDIVESVLIQGEEVLVVNYYDKIPWFKLMQRRGYKKEYESLVQELEVKDMIELIVLFKNYELLKRYKLIVINSFGNYYSSYVKNLKNIVNSSDVVNKFKQGMHKLFHLMQKTCHLGNSIIITVGSMKTFKQEMKVTSTETDLDFESEPELNKRQEPTQIIQKILVPTVSLISDLNIYYTNRIILYRDWVCDIDSQLLSGLNTFEESINLLDDGKLRCLPHWKCTTSKPTQNAHVWSTGFFLVDNSFQILDIDVARSKKVFLDDGDIFSEEESEIPDSQEC